MKTENYQINGKKGNWIATDTIIIDGKQFYLMEHQVSIPGLSSGRYPGRLWKNGCRRMREIRRKDKIKNP